MTQVGDTVKIVKLDRLHLNVRMLVEHRSGMVTEIADRGDVIVQFWDENNSPFQKRFLADEVGPLV